MSRPQQPELRRSQRGQVEQESWRRKAEADADLGTKGRTGPVPEGNRAGRPRTQACTNCEFDVPSGEQHCPRCGTELPRE